MSFFRKMYVRHFIFCIVESINTLQIRIFQCWHTCRPIATIEPESAMYSFGEKGELLPESAIRSFDKVAVYIDKKAFAQLKSDASLEKKAMDWVASLNMEDDKKAGFAVTTIYNHFPIQFT